MKEYLLAQNISNEIRFLIHSLFLGTVITFLYDNIRIARRLFKHHALFVSLEDLVFWIVVSFSIFTLQYYENNGVFRWFSILGALLGMFLYKETVGRFYVPLMTKVLKWILSMLYRFFAFVLTPFFMLEHKASGGVKWIARWMKRECRIQKNRLTRQIKMSRITLCKRKCTKECAGRNGHSE